MALESQDKSIDPTTGKLVVFEDKQIRRVFHHGEWFFSIIDIVEVLTGSPNPRRYWSNLKIQLSKKEGFDELYSKTVQLKFESSDGKKYRTDAANTETLLRVIQSIPSPKAEPFKRWLAKVGYERIQEIENPELATERTRALYKAKGYPDDWIEKRMRGIAVREELTAEWEKRGIEQENLRDHMTSLELIFSMLGEASTKEIAVNQNAQGFAENKAAAQSGGRIAGDARKQLEKESGKPVISKANYLSLTTPTSTKPIEIDTKKENSS